MVVGSLVEEWGDVRGVRGGTGWVATYGYGSGCPAQVVWGLPGAQRHGRQVVQGAGYCHALCPAFMQLPEH
ncbi:hypothetical protein GCM10010495_72520 [Kitasatospora herbaricolor]|nr:hypothetical protein GCM10010495_72520 [Kitasatospora herbaricolor]